MSYETEFRLPRLGEGDGGGRVINWLKQPGDAFDAEETLLEVETDKAVVEVPAPSAGRLVEVVAEVDDLVDFDEPVARVEFEGDAPESDDTDESEVSESETTAEAESLDPQATTDVHEPASPKIPAPDGARIVATPYARKLAAERGVTLSDLRGTGRGGRIQGRDVPASAPAARGVARSVPIDAASTMVSVGTGELHLKTWTPRERHAQGIVCFLHGLFADVDAWSANATVLARRGIPVAALDLPGHGRSASPAADIEAVVAQVVTAVGALARHPVILVGHSFGGAVAARAATRLGETVSALVLIAPVGLGTTIDQSFVDGMRLAKTIEALERETRKLTAKPMAMGREFLEPMIAQRRERGEQLASLCQAASEAGVQQLDIVPDLEGLTAPARIIHGRGDSIIPIAHAMNAPARTALHLVPGVGHMPQWESSALVNDIIASLTRPA